MVMSKKFAAASLAMALVAAPASAKNDPPQLVTCEQSMGSVALVEGDTQGWTEFGLGSPRELLTAMVTQSGCFTMHQPGMTGNADYLMNVVAGSQEEVDKSVEYAKAAATEGLLRSGAAGSLLSNVPVGGALLGMFGGLGGKKKTVAAGIKMISPANGQALAASTGSVKKSTISLGGAGGWVAGAQAAGYDSKNGKMLTEAFMIAFNAIVAQKAALSAAPLAVGETPTAMQEATVAVDTQMLAEAKAGSKSLRKLRAGTTLQPTGNRSGLYVEADDGYGTTGWVSVEDLQ